MEPRYNEAGALPGGYSGEQQCRRTQGEGMSVCTITALSFLDRQMVQVPFIRHVFFLPFAA